MIIKDTDNNTYKKKIKSRHNDIIRLGDYVKWNNQIWIITLLDTDDKVWNRGYMYLCQLMIRWQNVDGKIVERWGYSEDYTKYSMGEKGNSTITLGDYQYGLTILSYLPKSNNLCKYESVCNASGLSLSLTTTSLFASFSIICLM